MYYSAITYTGQGSSIPQASTEFHLRDHLGNTRIVLEEDENNTYFETHIADYYPFGMEIRRGDISQPSPRSGNNLSNRYLYNSKELQDDFGLNWYDYGARFYDPQIARWHSIDPHAENYLPVSPYAYVANNPIIFIDPDGRDIYRYDDKTGEFILYKETDDNYDQVGRFRRDRETGEYTLRTNRKGKARTRISHVEKGILSDGVNFQDNDYLFEVGGKGQPSEQGVKSFALNLSELVGKEISGLAYSSL